MIIFEYLSVKSRNRSPRCDANSLIAELESAIKSGTSEKRVKLGRSQQHILEPLTHS